MVGMYGKEFKKKKGERIEIWIDREIKTYLVGLHGRVNSSIDDDAAEWELTGDFWSWWCCLQGFAGPGIRPCDTLSHVHIVTKVQ